IGQTAPVLARLQLEGAVNHTTAIFGDNETGISLVADYPTIGFNAYIDNVGWKSLHAGYGGMINVDTSAGSMNFQLADTVAGPATAQTMLNRMTITNSGKVGINNPSPDTTLEVTGGLCVSASTGVDCTTADGDINADGSIIANAFDL